ncbi:8453_t:CDS:2 [Gigaspora margarita]|uniref:8453_t:CDS:1 n=1 Tax=Gigaspora margarita TaxID=4874 RepID=A0ABN7V1X4_GIGMA|nr:8453_t:CDS:2 [Gigaspora margarita]
MKDLIESYMLCDLDVPSQIQLLCGLFPKVIVVDYDVKNYVYKFHHNYEMQDAATNTYNLLLSIFAAVDNNFRSRIVAQAVMPDKTTMKVQPSAFIIDANLGLESIVPEVYSDTYLLYRIWHIGYNIEKLANSLVLARINDKLSEFAKYLLKQLHPCKTTWAKAFMDKMIDLSVVSKPFVRRKLYKDKVSMLYVPSFLDVAKSWNSVLTKPPVQTAAKAIGQRQSIKRTLLDDNEGSEILENEVVENNQIAKITLLDIQDPF